MTTTLLYLFAFVLVLSLVVIIHEGGHFFVARLCGVKVTEFSLGFGKKLFSKTDKKGTAWQIRAIPLGGYVKMLGDEDAASAKSSTKNVPEEDKDKTFLAQSLPKRAAIIFAGPAMNYVFAFVILWGVFWALGDIIIKPIVGSVQPDSAAEAAGILPKDEILAINETPITSFTDIQQQVTIGQFGKKLTLKIKRDEEVIFIKLTPKINEKTNLPLIGITPAGETAIVEQNLGPVQAFLKSGKTLYQMSRDTLVYLGQVLTFKRSGDQMRGPLGIAEASGDAFLGGFLSLILFVANISMAVGLMNLLPVPMLDGGHLFLYAIEAVRRKPLTEKMQSVLMWAGVCVLFSLFAYTMLLDIPRIIQRIIG